MRKFIALSVMLAAGTASATNLDSATVTVTGVVDGLQAFFVSPQNSAISGIKQPLVAPGLVSNDIASITALSNAAANFEITVTSAASGLSSGPDDFCLVGSSDASKFFRYGINVRDAADQPTSSRPNGSGASAGYFWKAGSGNPKAADDSTWAMTDYKNAAAVQFSNSDRLNTYTGIIELWVEGGQQYLKQDYANTLTVAFAAN